MTELELLGRIEQIVGRMAAAKGARAPKIKPDTALLGGSLPIDSLDLAQLVVELEQVAGFDPFKTGFVDFRTAGELAKLYQR